MLAEIFAQKREEVEAAKAIVPQDELVDRARAAGFPRGFRRALAKAKRPALIAEVKKASPSQGLIRPDFDPITIAQSYERAGATCLSVLTDEKFFQGSPENFVRVREATALPILRKDFLFDPYQVFESRAMGADAILLIAAMLNRSVLANLRDAANELGMDVLVEVHNEGELEIAHAIGFDLIGINNRNLSTFTTSIGISERLIPFISGTALVVSESAMQSHEDVGRVTLAGADAVLIGTTFCAAPDIEAKVKEVMGW